MNNAMLKKGPITHSTRPFEKKEKTVDGTATKKIERRAGGCEAGFATRARSCTAYKAANWQTICAGPSKLSVPDGPRKSFGS
jgi:hypothetical protein